MQNRCRAAAAGLAVTLLLVSCGGAAPTAILTPTPAAKPSPAPATPTPTPTPTSTPIAVTPTPTAAPSATASATPPASPTVADAQIQVGDRTRDYRVVAPPDVSTRDSLPLLLVLHGAEQSIRDAESYGFDVAVMESGAVVAYPQGEIDPENPGRAYIWNSGQTDTGFDDVAFIKALIERLAAEYPIDSKAIFILGASNGGQMAYRAACELSDLIAAVGDISGVLLVDCQPSSPVSVIDIHGADDTMVPLSGGSDGCLPLLCPPLADTQATWRQIDGCTGDPTAINIAPSSVETAWAACKNGTAVAFILADHANHFMQGIDFDLVAVIWDFLETHPRQ